MTIVEQGLNLMIFGMGTVFVFLTLLVFGTTAMSSLISRFFAEDPVATSNGVLPTPQLGETVGATELMVIQEAIKQHRQKSK